MAYHPYMREGNKKAPRHWFPRGKPGNTALFVAEAPERPLEIFDAWTLGRLEKAAHSTERHGGTVAAVSRGARRAQDWHGPRDWLTAHPLLLEAEVSYANLTAADLPPQRALHLIRPPLVRRRTAPMNGGCNHPQTLASTVTLGRFQTPNRAPGFLITLRLADLGTGQADASLTLQSAAPRYRGHPARLRVVAYLGATERLSRLADEAFWLLADPHNRPVLQAAKGKLPWQLQDFAGAPGSVERATWLRHWAERPGFLQRAPAPADAVLAPVPRPSLFIKGPR